jgi:hypothetical protein
MSLERHVLHVGDSGQSHWLGLRAIGADGERGKSYEIDLDTRNAGTTRECRHRPNP